MNYNHYLKIDTLLSLQKPVSEGPEHDETLFIIVHQVYELWFKEVLHELDYLCEVLRENDSSLALNTLKRLSTIFRTLIGQIDILETMTPLNFVSFRGRLEKASGFQSLQFREVEFLFGLKSERKMAQYPVASQAHQQLSKRYQQPGVWDAFLHYLVLNQYAIPETALNRDISQVVTPNLALQPILIDIYRHNPIITQICEYFVDLDAALQEWRFKHVKMVERTIGHKSGTGGSSGVAYLESTLSQTIFPDLWQIRTEF